MAGSRTQAIRPLTQQEIDRRIGSLLAEVADAGPQDGKPGADDAPWPRWISAAELVSRMQRFLVYN